MPRPLKQVVDYFPHMVNHGKTILVLRNEFQNDGYAFWFSLLELLCKSECQFYDYNTPAAWRLLLAETHVKEETASQILNILADIDAIDRELYQEKVIWVQNLVDNLDQVYDRRTTGKPNKPACHNILLPTIKSSLTKVTADKLSTETPVHAGNKEVNVDNNPASKVNNTKQDNTKHIYGEFTNVLLTDDELAKLKTRYGEADCLVKIEELSEGIASKGYKYSSHYATILSWERKHAKEKAAAEKNSGPAGGKHNGNAAYKPQPSGVSEPVNVIDGDSE